MSAALFSIVVDFQGGTYISQIEAANPVEAFDCWIVSFANDPETASIAAKLFNQSNIDGEGKEIVALDGLLNAWCTTISNTNGIALINLIKTAE